MKECPDEEATLLWILVPSSPIWPTLTGSISLRLWIGFFLSCAGGLVHPKDALLTPSYGISAKKKARF